MKKLFQINLVPFFSRWVETGLSNEKQNCRPIREIKFRTRNVNLTVAPYQHSKKCRPVIFRYYYDFISLNERSQKMLQLNILLFKKYLIFQKLCPIRIFLIIVMN